MRVFFIVCNYNAQRNGSLLDAMECLSKTKDENTTILLWDNASSDDSLGILRKFHNSGDIDHLVLAGKNMGKPYALNYLAKFAKDAYGCENDDIFVSMDSDICIRNTDFVKELVAVFSKSRRVGFVGYEYCDDEKLTHVSKYNKLVEGRHVFRSREIDICGIKYAPLSNFGGLLAGGLIVVRCGMFFHVGGYRLDTVNGGKSPIYGNDDATIEAALWNGYRDRFMFLFDSRKQILHRNDTDEGYSKWKSDVLQKFVKEPFVGNTRIPSKGYYD